MLEKSLAREAGLDPIDSERATSEPIVEKVRTMLEESNCLVAIITPSSLSDKNTTSWINQEIGMAYALKLLKKILKN